VGNSVVDIVPLDTIGEIDGWDRVAASAGCPIFYRSAFLASIASDPLLESRAQLLTLRTGGRLDAALPIFSQPQADPIGLLSRLHETFPDLATRPAILSHCWHCYDTRIALFAASADIRRLVEALHAQAAAEQAGYFGLISVSDPATLELMAQCGLPPRYTNDRFIMDVGRFRGFEDYVGTLHPDIRRELRRQHRLFATSGAAIAVEKPPIDDLDKVVALCRRTAARYAGEFYYPSLATGRLLERLGPSLRLISVRVGGERIGVLVCFFEPPRFHIWAAGMRYDLAKFSPYAMSMCEAIRYAIASGMTRVEGGRGNARIKLKQGFSPLKLYACIRATS
jgi:hypothetical protein